MSGGPAALLSVAMLASFALVVGAVAFLRRGERRRGVLMIVAALVLAANVAVWTL